MMEDPSEWKFHEKTFQDAVHGAMTFHPLCVKVIDTPQFQRLRFIKTVGSSYFVFPAASHNRFEHCLGVCYLAGELVCALQSRQPELGISEADVLCVQLGGLCHDLGHGPFSHLWEHFVNQARPKKHWTHESNSAKMFDYLLEVNNLVEDFRKYGLNEQDITFIKEIICSVPVDGSEWCYKGRPKEKAFLYQIVANKQTGIDVDKWDYFLRDSHNLGIKVTFDYHRLIQFSRVISVENEGPQICIRDKECNNVYDMFHARRVLHRTAYKHRVALTIDSMIIDAFLYADKHICYLGSNGVRYPLADVCDDMMAYTNLNDSVLNLIQLDERDHPDLLQAKKIISDIFRRQLYPCVGHTKPNNPSTTSKNVEEALERNIPQGSTLTPKDLVVSTVELNYGMKDQNPVEMVYFYNKNSPMKTKKIMQEESILLPERFQEKIFTVFCRSIEEDRFKHAQETLKAACQQLDMKKPYVEFFPTPFSPVKNRKCIEN